MLDGHHSRADPGRAGAAGGAAPRCCSRRSCPPRGRVALEAMRGAAGRAAPHAAAPARRPARVPPAAPRARSRRAAQLGAWALQWLACWLLLMALGLDSQRRRRRRGGRAVRRQRHRRAARRRPPNVGVFQAACVAVLAGAYHVSPADAIAYGIVLQARRGGDRADHGPARRSSTRASPGATCACARCTPRPSARPLPERRASAGSRPPPARRDCARRA